MSGLEIFWGISAVFSYFIWRHEFKPANKPQFIVTIALKLVTMTNALWFFGYVLSKVKFS